MSYSTATPAQQAQVNAFSLQVRATAIVWFRLMNQINAETNFWDSTVLGILGSPSGIPIPDGTGLAGAVEMTDTQLTNIVGIMQNMVTTYFTSANQQAMGLAVGPTNIGVT